EFSVLVKTFADVPPNRRPAELSFHAIRPAPDSTFHIRRSDHALVHSTGTAVGDVSADCGRFRRRGGGQKKYDGQFRYRAGALGLEGSTRRRGQEPRLEHLHRRAEVHRGARWHDGWHKLPVADGLRDEPR